MHSGKFTNLTVRPFVVDPITRFTPPSPQDDPLSTPVPPSALLGWVCVGTSRRLFWECCLEGKSSQQPTSRHCSSPAGLRPLGPVPARPWPGAPEHSTGPTGPGSPPAHALSPPSFCAVSRETWSCSKAWHLLPLNKRTPPKKTAFPHMPPAHQAEVDPWLRAHSDFSGACALHSSKHPPRPRNQATHH